MSVRIIPCLDIKDGRVVKGVQFAGLKDAGDPLEVAVTYDKAGADELVLLDISPSYGNRENMYSIVKEMLRELTIPLIIGGGIRDYQDFKRLLDLGVDRVTINSAAIKHPQLISEVAQKLGSKNITIAIDAKRTQEGNWSVFVDGGKINTYKDVIKWAIEVQTLGAGEILLTSMDKDGTRDGYDIALLKAVTEQVDIPIIASGGAGNFEHFLEAITEGGASAVLAASLFHFREVEIGDLKRFLKENGINIAGEKFKTCI